MHLPSEPAEIKPEDAYWRDLLKALAYANIDLESPPLRMQLLYTCPFSKAEYNNCVNLIKSNAGFPIILPATTIEHCDVIDCVLLQTANHSYKVITIDNDDLYSNMGVAKVWDCKNQRWM
jgi:hypothetical protein